MRAHQTRATASSSLSAAGLLDPPRDAHLPSAMSMPLVVTRLEATDVLDESSCLGIILPPFHNLDDRVDGADTRMQKLIALDHIGGSLVDTNLLQCLA